MKTKLKPYTWQYRCHKHTERIAYCMSNLRRLIKEMRKPGADVKFYMETIRIWTRTTKGYRDLLRDTRKNKLNY